MKTRELWMAARTTGAWKKTAVLALGVLAIAATQAQAQATSSSSGSTIAAQPQTTPRTVNTGKIGPSAPVTYDNKYEIYGGLNFMNFQAGDHLPTRMNMGGGEAMFTYWLPSGSWYSNLGIAADYRGEAGTTPVFASARIYSISRPLVYMNMGMLGAQYRGPKNQHMAIDYHALGGVSTGIFDSSRRADQPYFYQYTGLYNNSTKPIYALGGSIDFNESHRFAIRLQPDLMLEHFGSHTREFFAISGGLVYRIGKVK